VAVIAAIALVGAAGALAWRTFDKQSSPASSPSPSSSPYPGSSLALTASADALVVHLAMPPHDVTVDLPIATVSFGDQVLRMDTHQATGDWRAPQPLGFTAIGHIFGAPVPSGTELDIVGDASSATATISPMGRGGQSVPIELQDGVGRLPLRAGTYDLFVSAYWRQGQAQFAVYVAVTGM